VGTKNDAQKGDLGGAAVDLNDPKQLQGLSLRLLAFARRRAKVKRWWLGMADALAKGNTVDDIVCEAMASLFGGPRRWDPKTQPDVWEHLKSVVNSVLSNLVRAKENRVNKRGVEPDLAAVRETPESEMLSVEHEEWLERRRVRAYSLLQEEALGANDEALLSLHDLILKEDIHKPQELAKRLNVSVNAVNNLKRRFWRICRRVLEVVEREEGQAND
jgi:DNA-directed RNA polymerase specialized sigma24 family protein